MSIANRASVVVLHVALLLAAGAVCRPAGADEEADHNALRAMRQAFETAVNANNLDAFEPWLADGFSIVTFTDREFTDFVAFKEQWQKTRSRMLEGGTYRVSLEPELSVILGDIAICRGNSLNILTTGGGREFRFRAKWSAVCRRTEGGWKVLRAHNSLDPFGNPMLRSRVRSLLVQVSALAALIGLLAGGGIVAIARRRRAA